MKESDLEENGGYHGEQTDEIANSPATITRPKVSGLQPLQINKGLKLRMMRHKSFLTSLPDDSFMSRVLNREDDDDASETIGQRTEAVTLTTALPIATLNAKGSK